MFRIISLITASAISVTAFGLAPNLTPSSEADTVVGVVLVNFETGAACEAPPSRRLLPPFMSKSSGTRVLKSGSYTSGLRACDEKEVAQIETQALASVKDGPEVAMAPILGGVVLAALYYSICTSINTITLATYRNKDKYIADLIAYWTSMGISFSACLPASAVTTGIFYLINDRLVLPGYLERDIFPQERRGGGRIH